jgi:hypothetical protein
VSEFVDECRREWKRLGVADQLAEEMAAELVADLDEAESEGASAADVLGSSAMDPRSLAASWAFERGLVHPRATEPVFRGHRRALAVVVTFGFLVVIGGAAALLASETGQRAPLTAQRGQLRLFAPFEASSQPIVLDARSMRPIVVARASVEALTSQGGDNTEPIAWILLAVGVVGIISASLLWTTWRRNRPPAPA